MTDPIADYLTRLRNAMMAKHKIVEIPASNLKKDITKILYDKGYILNYKFEDDGVQGTIKIALKYHPETKQPAIKSLEERSADPACGITRARMSLPRVLNGLGIAILSTSQGVMSDKEARKKEYRGRSIVLCILMEEKECQE
jgi:small subunit ribosomal protein S8